MPHALCRVQFAWYARAFKRVRHGHSVVQQKLGFPGEQKRGRKAGNIPKQRGNKRVLQIIRRIHARIGGKHVVSQ